MRPVSPPSPCFSSKSGHTGGGGIRTCRHHAEERVCEGISTGEPEAQANGGSTGGTMPLVFPGAGALFFSGPGGGAGLAHHYRKSLRTHQRRDCGGTMPLDFPRAQVPSSSFLTDSAQVPALPSSQPLVITAAESPSVQCVGSSADLAEVPVLQLKIAGQVFSRTMRSHSTLSGRFLSQNQAQVLVARRILSQKS